MKKFVLVFIALAVVTAGLFAARTAAASAQAGVAIANVAYAQPFEGSASVALTVQVIASRACQKPVLSEPSVNRSGPARYDIAYAITTQPVSGACPAEEILYPLTNTSLALPPGVYSVVINGIRYGELALEPAAVFWSDYRGEGAQIAGAPLRGPVQYDGKSRERVYLGCLYRDPKYPNHGGWDFPVPIGTPVYTVMGGQVVFAGYDDLYGNMVVVENSGQQVRYAHLSQIQVAFGQVVAPGAQVGLAGNTGGSSGPHLHLDIRLKQPDGSSASVDPGRYLDASLFDKFDCWAVSK